MGAVKRVHLAFIFEFHVRTHQLEIVQNYRIASWRYKRFFMVRKIFNNFIRP
jgi:hypothetical protein